MTALIAGPASEIGDEQIQQMAAVAGRRLADVPPPTVTVGKVLYHPEAIMLAARPPEALLPVLEAAREATQEVTGSPGRAGSKLPWTPHITIAYSTAHQPDRANHRRARPVAAGTQDPDQRRQPGQPARPRTPLGLAPEATIRFGSSP